MSFLYRIIHKPLAIQCINGVQFHPPPISGEGADIEYLMSCWDEGNQTEGGSCLRPSSLLLRTSTLWLPSVLLSASPLWISGSHRQWWNTLPRTRWRSEALAGILFRRRAHKQNVSWEIKAIKEVMLARLFKSCPAAKRGERQTKEITWGEQR